MAERDRTTPYLAILVEKRYGGHMQTHAGLAVHGRGKAMCNDALPLWEFELTARDPRFGLREKDGVRHRYAEAWLELNRGCRPCLEIMYQLAHELGYAPVKSLTV